MLLDSYQNSCSLRGVQYLERTLKVQFRQKLKNKNSRLFLLSFLSDYLLNLVFFLVDDVINVYKSCTCNSVFNFSGKLWRLFLLITNLCLLFNVSLDHIYLCIDVIIEPRMNK